MLSNLSARLKKTLPGSWRRNGIKKSEGPTLTYAFIAFLAAIYFLELACTADGFAQTRPSSVALISLGSLSKEVIAKSDEWYRVITAPYLNGSVVALMFNLFGLFFLGSAFERQFGRLWLFAFTIVAAAAGSLIALALNPASTIAVGTAGVMSGLGIALYVSSFSLNKEERDRLQVRVLCTLAVLLWPIVNGVRHNSGTLNYGAHMGGALIGIMFGGVMLKIWKPNSPALPLHRLALSLTIIGSLILVLSVITAAIHYPLYRNMRG